MNPPERKTGFRVLVALLLCVLLAGCGSSRESAQSIVNDTFHSHRQINSGRLDLSFSLSAAGLSSLSAPVSLQVTGPFESLGTGRLPHFALAVDLSTGGHSVHAGGISTAGKFFVTLEGIDFQAPKSTVTELQRDYASSSKTAASQSHSTFAGLGVNPGGWLEHPVRAGAAVVGGEQTIHLTAGLDLARFLADTERLSGAGNALGLGASAPGTGLLSKQQSAALTDSISSARIDLYTGAKDHLLRSLRLHATVSATGKNRTVLGGLRNATLTLRLQFSNLNQPQEISSPSKPRPISELVTVLQQTGLISGGSSSGVQGIFGAGGGESSGSTSGESASTEGSSGQSSGQSYAQCVRSAAQSVSALQKCAALLGG